MLGLSVFNDIGKLNKSQLMVNFEIYLCTLVYLTAYCSQCMHHSM